MNFISRLRLTSLGSFVRAIPLQRGTLQKRKTTQNKKKQIKQIDEPSTAPPQIKKMLLYHNDLM